MNLGFRFTVLGNSDTHGLTSTEAGCPRNYVMSETDDPAFLDDQAIAEAVREHRVVASYGPFVQMWVDDEPIGSELVPEGDEITIRVDVQAPTWIGVDRLELYENGTLVEEVDIEDSGDPLERWSGSFARTPQQDSWYVVIVMADDDLAPVFSPVEIPYVDLQEVVVEALAGVEAISSLLEPAAPIPRIYPVPSLAVTNPIWVDLAGDGFDAPGLPEWLARPEPPETSE